MQCVFPEVMDYRFHLGRRASFRNLLRQVIAERVIHQVHKVVDCFLEDFPVLGAALINLLLEKSAPALIFSKLNGVLVQTIKVLF